jgi:hypothetical protein
LQAKGQPCDSDDDCTGTCVGGICIDGFAGPGATCDDKYDCSNQVCALETAKSTKAVCCPSGASAYVSSPIFGIVCTGQVSGAVCAGSDTLCKSGVCVQGVCQ